VITADALQTHPEAAEFLVTEKRAHYLFMVKGNQPTLLARCAGLPWHRVPVLDRTCDRGHGRIEHRALKAVTVGRFGFPHAAQVIQVTRKRTVGGSHASTRRRRWQTVTVYAITSLPFQLASPARVADLLRGHWAIETLHRLRDVTFCEDASQVRTGAGPHVMACLRNLVIGVLSQAGRSTSPPRCAATPATPADPWPPSGSASDETDITTDDGAQQVAHPPEDCGNLTEASLGSLVSMGQPRRSWSSRSVTHAA
jgi:predicted transposase YbfD/YdcC